MDKIEKSRSLLCQNKILLMILMHLTATQNGMHFDLIFHLSIKWFRNTLIPKNETSTNWIH